MSEASATVSKKVVKAFGAYDLRRAQTYVQGKSGYAPGFLPPRSSPVRFPELLPTVERTAASKSVADSQTTRKAGGSHWTNDLTTRRRKYMVDHIEQETSSKAKKLVEDKQRMITNRKVREAKLNSPGSAFEVMSLPSIESMVTDEYPLIDPDKEMRAIKRTQNRLNRAEREREGRLHQFLTIHHKAQEYATSVGELEDMLNSEIPYQKDYAPGLQYFGTTRTSSRINAIESDVFDQVLGTSAGQKPGVVEISQLLETTKMKEPLNK